ncbi:MAG: hypothetical protein IBX69_16310 [Anaerolineales bacterium]|nr:hypothetical protein [Anaerolineales bacterium]
MSTFPSMIFIPGRSTPTPGLLTRYLPPLPEGVVTKWLHEKIPSGAWVLDPFGMSPNLVVEAARAGYRVLVAANNPINRFLIELASTPPTEEELSATLADLAASRKGEERLEPHLRSLYETKCAECENVLMPQALLWEREASAPYARIYECPHCGDSGERPVNREDLEKASQFSASGMHRARALERVVSHNDPDRSHVAEALLAYLPRALYVLITLINKLESMSSASPEGQLRQRLLTMLLLNTFDDGNTLWPYPTARARPRQIIVPTRFRENNLWLSLERAARTHNPSPDPIPLVHWPEQLPSDSGVVIFEGRLKDLVEGFRSGISKDIRIDAVIGAFPRPNQAYWTLSALWAGWLWGREAVTPFKSALRRRRYDWAWHSSALSATLQHLTPRLSPGTPFLGLIGEVEPSFMSAAIIALQSCGFTVDGLALRAGSGQAQIAWQWRSKTEQSSTSDKDLQNELPTQIEGEAARAAFSLLKQRGEPASYVRLHTAALLALANSNTIPISSNKTPADVYSFLHTVFERTFTHRQGFLHFTGIGASASVSTSTRFFETGQWWTQPDDNFALPLADRVEYAVVDHLHSISACSASELDQVICEMFPGLLTPDREIIQACLDSYSVQLQDDGEKWRLSPQEEREQRTSEVNKMREMLDELGERLGFHSTGDHPLFWENEQGEKVFAFYILVSACFGDILTSTLPPTTKRWIVIPGSRSGLVLYKINHNPYFKSLLASGWQFLKFRHLRGLLGLTNLNRQNLEHQMGLDPLTETASQMRLL